LAGSESCVKRIHIETAFKGSLKPLFHFKIEDPKSQPLRLFDLAGVSRDLDVKLSHQSSQPNTAMGIVKRTVHPLTGEFKIQWLCCSTFKGLTFNVRPPNLKP